MHMSEINADALRKQLKSGQIGCCYLLYGPEKYLLDHYSRELRSAVLGAEDDPFNLRQLEGKNLDLQELSEAVDAYPSFAERSLIEVRDYEFFPTAKKKKAEQEDQKEQEAREDTEAKADLKRLFSILEDLPEYCCLVFLYDTVDFNPDKRKKKLWEQLTELVTVVEFPLQGQGELTRWIRKHFAARGKEISTEDASYLLFVCGSQMDNLTNEIGKVAVYARDRRVRREDIDAVVIPVVEAQAYKLTDAIAARDFERAAELMYKLFQLNMQPTALNAMIGSQLRKLYAARLVKEAGGNASTLMQLIGDNNSYGASQNLRICTSFPEAWYLRMIRLCAETDLRFKSSQADPEDLLRSLFVTMVSEA